MPTLHQTSGNCSAIACTRSNSESFVPIVTQVPTPASRARPTTAATCGAKSGKSRWQWLSTSMGTQKPGLQSAAPRRVRERVRGGQDRLSRLQMQRRGSSDAREQPLAKFHPAVEMRAAGFGTRDDAVGKCPGQKCAEDVDAVVDTRDLV